MKNNDPDVTIIDYGMGNILSVKRAFEYCGSNANVSNEPKTIAKSNRLVLPGVGAFGNGMKNLKKSNLIDY